MTEPGKISYRFRCPGPGVFQCALTGLVFVMTQEAELLYTSVQWDESLLQSAGKMAAGLLFSIKSSEDAAVCQLHFPHCETLDAPLPEGLLSVVHIVDDGMSILEPLEVTDTHVAVKVPHLSLFGLVWDIVKRLWTRPVCSRVLLFLGPPNPRTERQNLNLFLLPRNADVDKVNTQQQRHSEVNIQAPSTCKLIKDQSYSLYCQQAIKVQPTKAEVDLEFGPSYQPTFEIRLPTNSEEVNLTIQDQRQREVWQYDADLTEKRCVDEHPSTPVHQAAPLTDRQRLLKMFVQLKQEEFKQFKWYLEEKNILPGLSDIPKSRLENTDMLDLVDLMVQTYGQQSVEVTKTVFRKIDRNDLVQTLSDSSQASGSSA